MMTWENIESQWACLLTLLNADLEQIARETGALARKRVVRSGSDLLRLVLAYAWCNLSLKSVSGWMLLGDQRISSVALFKRLRNCSGFLGALVAQQLKVSQATLTLSGLKKRVRVFDATCINRPGSKGTDWRLHLGLDLESMCIDDAWLTNAKVGESFRNFKFMSGDIALADRIYGERKGIRWVVEQGADVVVRINYCNLPLQDLNGKDIDILEYARQIETGKAGDWSVQTKPCQDVPEPIGGRLIVLRKSLEASEKERRRINKEYRKKGRAPTQQTLEACDYIFIFTTLSIAEVSTQQILEIYRFRWQVELCFKRLKGILEIDELNVRSDQLCRTFILAKLLLALLIERLTSKSGAFPPWGYGFPTSYIPGTDICQSDVCI